MNELKIDVNEEWIGIHVEGGGYREFIHLLKQRTHGSLYSIPLLTVNPPCCDTVRKWNTFQDIPAISVPCPCGNPNHWLIKYDK